VVLAAGAPDGSDAPEYRTLAAHVALEPAVEPGPGAPPTAADLRAFLAARLPAYMLPASLAVHPELPSTPGGKIDRAALRSGRTGRTDPPEPSVASAAATAPAEAATSAPPAPMAPMMPPAAVEPDPALAGLVAGIWREVLGVAEVGRDDNFFDLGGHSMLLTLVHARLQEALAADLSMLDLFNHPTVRTLAAHLSGTLGGAAAAPDVD